jgi:hypothetical protein
MGLTCCFLFIFPFELSSCTFHPPITTTTIRVDPSIDEPNLVAVVTSFHSVFLCVVRPRSLPCRSPFSVPTSAVLPVAAVVACARRKRGVRHGYCRMDLPGPTASVGTRTNYPVGPWDYSACATRHLMAWGARTTVGSYTCPVLCRELLAVPD